MKKTDWSIIILVFVLLPVSLGVFHNRAVPRTQPDIDRVPRSKKTTTEHDADIFSDFNPKKLSASSSIDLWYETVDYFYVTYSIWSDGEFFYTSGTGEYNRFDPFGGTNVRVIKWHYNGTKMWDLEIGHWIGALGHFDYGYGIWGDNESNVFVCSYSGYGPLLIKIHSNGTIIWEKACDGDDIWGDDTNIYIGGNKLRKWDFDGNEIWVKNVSGGSLTDIWGVNSYLYTCSYYGEVSKWDLDGNQLWNVSCDETPKTELTSISSDGTSIYTTGLATSLTAQGSTTITAVLIKWNQNGDMIWKKNCSDRQYSSLQSVFYSDGYIYTFGDVGSSVSSTAYNMLLQKWNIDGTIVWSNEWTNLNPKYEYGKGLWVNSSSIITTGLFVNTSYLYEMIVHVWDTDGNTIFKPRSQAPELLDITQNQDSLFLNWTEVEGASLYCIYISDSYPFEYADFWSIATVNETSYVDYGIMEGTYYYMVTALNHHGESEGSNIVSVGSTIKENNIHGFNTQWAKLRGDSGNDYGESIWGDNHFLYTCETRWNYETNSYDVYVRKWNKRGEELWTYRWGDSNDQEGNGIWGDNNHIYVSGEEEGGNGFLLKLDKKGNKVWSNELDSYVFSMWGCDSFIYTLGQRLTQWTKDGEKQWEQYRWGHSVWCDEDNVYILYAEKYSSDRLYKYSNEGVEIYEIDDDLDYEVQGIWSDTQYLYIFGNDLIQLDFDGDVLWDITLDGKIECVRRDGDTLYALGKNDGDLALCSIEENGAWHEMWRWGGQEDESGSSLHVGLNYLYFLGSTNSFGRGNSDLVLIKWGDYSLPIYSIIEIILAGSIIGLIIISGIILANPHNRKIEIT